MSTIRNNFSAKIGLVLLVKAAATTRTVAMTCKWWVHLWTKKAKPHWICRPPWVSISPEIYSPEKLTFCSIAQRKQSRILLWDRSKKHKQIICGLETQYFRKVSPNRFLCFPHILVAQIACKAGFCCSNSLMFVWSQCCWSKGCSSMLLIDKSSLSLIRRNRFCHMFNKS